MQILRPKSSRHSSQQRTDRSVIFGVALLTCVFGLGASVASLTPQQARVTVEEVAGRVHVLYGRGGNIGLFVGDDAVLLIDDQFAPLARKIERAVSTVADRDIDFLLNTHWHGDHTGGNEYFGAGARIVAHENVRRRLAADPTIGGRLAEDTPRVALPVLTFDDGISFHLGGERVRVRHMPSAHTDGDSIVIFEGSKVVHMGDIYFQGRFPFVDTTTGGTVDGVLSAVNSVLAECDDEWKFIPGHGRVSGRAELLRYQAMLIGTMAIVERAVKSGKDAGEIESEGLLDEWSEWGPPQTFVTTRKWIETLVGGVSGD